MMDSASTENKDAKPGGRLNCIINSLSKSSLSKEDAASNAPSIAGETEREPPSTTLTATVAAGEEGDASKDTDLNTDTASASASTSNVVLNTVGGERISQVSAAAVAIADINGGGSGADGGEPTSAGGDESQSSVCSECSSVIRNAANLAVHMRRHSGYKPYHCSKCTYTGYDQDDVHRHASRSHTSGAPAHVRFKPDAEMEKSVTAMIAKCKKFKTPTPTTTSAASAPAAAATSGLKETAQSLLSPPKPPPYTAAQMSLIQALLRRKTTEINKGNAAALVSPGSPDVRCELCSAAVKTDVGALITHLKCHLNFAGYACGLCDLSCPSWAALTEHMTQAHQASAAAPAGRRLLADSLLSLAEYAFTAKNAALAPKLPCSLCQTGVPLRKAAVDAHVTEHEAAGSFKCAMCTQRFVDVHATRQHIAAKHAGSFVLFSYAPKVFSQAVDQMQVYDRAFPFLMPEILESSSQSLKMLQAIGGTVAEDDLNTLRSAPETPAKATIECLLCCGQISRNMSCLIAHAKVHLAYKPLKCEYCSFRHFAMSKIKRHNVRVHAGKAVKVSYHPISDIGRQVKEMKLKCFGAHASSTVWASADVAASSNGLNEMFEEMDCYDDSCSPLPTADAPAAAAANSSSLFPPSLADAGSAVAMRTDGKPPITALLEQLMRTSQQMSSNNGGISSKNNSGSAAFCSDDEDDDEMSGRSSSAGDGSGVGKKMCSVCNVFLANNSNSFENHANKHLDYKPYHCHFCSYQSYTRGKVTRHIQQVHEGFQIKIHHKPQPGMKEKVLTMKMQCFPFLLNEDGSDLRSASKLSDYSGIDLTSPDGENRCRLCDTIVNASQVTMDEHIQTHITKKQYRCPACSYETSLFIRAKQHLHSAHQSNHEARIICCPPDGLKGLCNLRISCFGAGAWQGGVDGLSTDASPAKSTAAGDKMVLGRTTNGVSMNDAVQQMIQLQQQLLALQQQNQAKKAPPTTGGADEDEAPLPVLFDNDSMTPTDYTSAYPYYKPGGGQRTPHLNCSLCKAVVVNETNAIAVHVKKHAKEYAPYQCNYCVWKSTTESAVRHHQAQSHKGQPVRVLVNDEREETARVQEQCFPQTRLSALLNGSLLTRGGNSGSNGGSAGGTAAANSNTSTPTSSTAPTAAQGGGGMLKKLICQICKNTIADNPKSIGIHVKNHLNYKPYRCPFCKYMSCEQSKARRHVEHVHNQSGEMVEIHAQDGIKEKIVDMKAQCFPSLMNRSETMESLLLEDTNSNSNLVFPSASTTDTVAPDATVGGSGDEKMFSLSDYAKGFLPELITKEEKPKLREVEAGDLLDDSLLNNVPPPLGGTEGKLECRACKNWVSVNPNSLEVHTKTHLNFKQHQCGYCAYRSCIAGKVKRHIDNVHTGEPKKVFSFTSLTAGLRKVINDMRTTCFPQLEGNVVGSAAEVKIQTEILKQQLLDELQSDEILQLPPNEQEAVRSAYRAAVNATESLNAAGSTSSLFDGASSGGVNTSSGGLSLPGMKDDDDEFADDDEDEDDEDEEDDETSSLNTADGSSKLICQQCMLNVADNPSSVGLHVRNHLDYKPFSCNLCDYKSCIQAKVKRHLRNVHKCPTDEMTYAPEPDIRLKVMDMKLRCFPKMAEAAESALGGGIDNNANNIDFSSFLSGGGSAKRPVSAEGDGGVVSSKKSRLDSILGAKMIAGFLNSAGVASTNDDTAARPAKETCTPSPSSLVVSSVVQCQICSVKVPNDELSRTRHLTNHMNESQWQCSDCEFNSFIQNSVRRHITETHEGESGSSAQPIRLGGNRSTMATSEYQKLTFECFVSVDDDDGGRDESTIMSNDGGDSTMLLDDDIDDDDDLPICTTYKFRKTKNTFDGPRYICKICGQAVSMYASSLYVHVKNHMNYKPYCCAHCDYRSPVKSKVRRHIQNAHRELPMTINYFPTPGIEHEVLRMKKKCFPDVTSFATLTNDKVPCQVCKTDVSDTPLSKSVHAKNHLDAKPYHCGYCSYRSCLKGETRRHVTRQHTGKALQIHFVDTEVAVKEDVDTMVMRCFPNTDAASLNAIAPDPLPATTPSTSTPRKTPSAAASSVSPAKSKTPVSPASAPAAEVRSSGRQTRSSMAASSTSSVDRSIKLGQAFREWHCPYCVFSNTSKYHVKEHVIGVHPGHEVHVSGAKKNF